MFYKSQESFLETIELVPDEVKILNEAEKLLFYPSDKTDISEENKYQMRHISLRMEKNQKPLLFKSKIILQMRNFLCKNLDFIDIETPVLFRATPGGAQEFVVPTRQKGLFYSLPQSPQQFKQLLMISGFERYMQIAKCFRDESTRFDRQPEFTQLDLEASFVSRGDIYSIIENLFIDSWPLVREFNKNAPELSTPFHKMDYSEAMERFGSDKPDTRFEMYLQTLDDRIEFFMPASLSKNIPQSDVKKLLNYANNLQKEVRITFTNTQNGIKVSTCNKSKLGRITLGSLRKYIGDYLDKLMEGNFCKNKFNFLWVENFNLFEKTEKGYETVHHPFTAPIDEHIEMLHSDPSKVISQHYDLVCNGQEVGGGSIRIHDPQMQEYVLENILNVKTKNLKHLLDALRSGAPPHGGIALGLERLLSILYGCDSLKDVIAFPKSLNQQDSYFKAPTQISKEILDLYHIKVKE